MTPITNETDHSLLKQAKRGNQAAFGRLVQRHQKKVLYLAYDLVGDYEQARDIVQDVFIRAFEHLDGFEERAKFSSWIYRITVNLAMDHHRRRGRRQQQSLETAMREIDTDTSRYSETDSTDSSVLLSERHEMLEAAIATLSEQQQTAVVLRYFHQKSGKEIAEIMGCSEATVRIHIFRALKTLSRRIKKQDI